MFVGLWTLADRDGRLEDRPRQIKLNLYPADNFDVSALLDELVNAKDDSGMGIIIRYEAEDKKCVWIPKFTLHQTPHNKEKPSSLPAFDAKAQKLLGKPRKNRASRKKVGREVAPTPLIPDSCILNSDSGTLNPEPRIGEKKSRPPNPVWDTVVYLFFQSGVAPGDKSRIGKVVRDLKAKDATPEEISRRYEIALSNWDDHAFSPEALVKNWDQVNELQAKSSNSKPRNISRIAAKPGKYDHIPKQSPPDPPF